MEIIKDILSDRITRELPNGLIEVKEFYENGELQFHYFKNKNSKYHIEWKSYYENGQIKSHTFYKNSILHGECKLYYKDGQLWVHKLFKNGELVKDYLK